MNAEGKGWVTPPGKENLIETIEHFEVITSEDYERIGTTQWRLIERARGTALGTVYAGKDEIESADRLAERELLRWLPGTSMYVMSERARTCWWLVR